MNLKTRLKTTRLDQHGFTLVELLVAMVIGLFILSAVLSMFVSMLKSDSDNIKAIQLNQELRGAMSLITRDIRRAGANQNAAADATATPPANPFSVAGGTRLTLAANEQGNANACIIYAYDANDGSNERFGFRLNSAAQTVETRGAAAACNAATNWSALTDNTLVAVTGLTFADTTVVQAGINIRAINVTLSGSLVRDATVTRTITESVKIRNEEF